MSDSLALLEITLRRTPGFPRGGPSLRELSTGINIVFGPQQSGKTSTAEAIHWLLWPRSADRYASLHARFDIGGVDWIAEMDGGRTRWQSSTGSSVAPALPPAEQRDRYRLALSDLLLGDNRGFAEAIARESLGGYDLGLLAEAVGARSAPSRSSGLQQSLQLARQKLNELRAEEREVREAESQLPRLEQELVEARGAASRVRLLELAITLCRAREHEGIVSARLADFPEILERLQADDASRFKQLRRTIGDAEEGIRRGRSDAVAAEEALLQTGLQEEVSTGVLASLEEELRQLEEATRELLRLGAEREKQRAILQSAERAFAGAIHADQLSALDLDAARKLERLSREATALRQERLAAEALVRLIDETGPIENSHEITKAIACLSEWLRLPDPAARAKRSMVGLAVAGIGIVGFILLASLLGLLVDPAFYVLIMVGVLLGAVLVVGRRTPQADERARVQQRLEELSTVGPSSWTAPDVLDRIRELERERAQLEVSAENAARAKEARGRLEVLRENEQVFQESSRGLVSSVGLPPDIELESLHWLFERILRWQTAADALAALEREMATREAQQREKLDDLHASLRRFGAGAETDVAGVRAALVDLRRRSEVFQDATRRRAAATEKIQELERSIAAAEVSRAELLQRLGIALEDESRVEAWCSMLEEYRALSRSLTAARAETRVAREALEAAAGFDPAILTLPISVLEEEIEHTRSRAERVSKLQQMITATHTRIDDALRRHRIEAALAGVEEAEERVRRARDADIEAIVRQKLIDYIRETTSDQRRPEVFHSARRWFSLITHGRCELEFVETDPVGFRATDTSTGLSHSLGELSGGTRVQLLLAVRTAFVETLETGLKLPILLDETLATADDQRAAAIIEAIVQMARAGRQVFYFTAQVDEVSKWQSALAEESIPSRVIDLRGAGADFQRTVPDWLRVDRIPPPAAPETAGHDHDSYGAALAVPAIDPVRDDVARVHLWYLIEDLELLRRCLGLGIERFGPLVSFLEHGGAEAVPGLTGERPKIQARARAMQEFIAACRIGRGMPVDRAVLEESGAVSSTFLDRVSDVVRMTGGDANELVTRLESGAVKGFRSDKLEQLRTYLLDQGYLDPNSPLSEEELRMRVMAGISQELRHGLLLAEEVRMLLRRLARPPRGRPNPNVRTRPTPLP